MQGKLIFNYIFVEFLLQFLEVLRLDEVCEVEQFQLVERLLIDLVQVVGFFVFYFGDLILDRR